MYQRELQPKRVLQHGPIQFRCRSRRGYDQLLAEDILDFLGLRAASRKQHRTVAKNAPDPLEFGGVYSEFRRAEDLVEVDRLIQHANRRAVLARHIVEIIGGADAARAGHVLRDDGWTAVQMPSDMARDQAAIGIVAAADRGPDHEGDGFAFVVALRSASGIERQQQKSHSGK